MTGIMYRSKVKRLDERKQVVRGWKNKDGQAEFETEVLGHGLVLEGSRECIVFNEKPPFEVGDLVEVTIRKIEGDDAAGAG